MANKHDENNSSDWKKHKSKTHPGREYLFNLKTGETKWISKNYQAAGENSRTPIKLPEIKSRTPAQDRLKRLQNNFNKKSTNSSKKIPSNDANCESQQNDCKRNASNSTHGIRKNSFTTTDKRVINKPEPSKPLKRINNFSLPETPRKRAGIEKESATTESSILKPLPSQTSTSPPSSTATTTPTSPPSSTATTTPTPPPTSTSKSSAVSSALNFISNIVNKFKRPTSIASSKNENRVPTENNNRKRKVTQTNNSIEEQCTVLKPLALPLAPQVPPTSIITKGTANKRLELMRQSLQKQHNQKNQQQPPNNTNDAVEPMDWQSIDIELPTLALETAVTATPPTISEHYATVNENLLRLASEKERSMENWLLDHYYIIIDTNVILRFLCFIEELCEMKLCNTKGTVVFIPYAVLQELDKLKMRTEKPGTMVSAIRAIKFLNEKLKTRDKHVKAQSAIEERKQLIRITTADDSIINCCLQVKQHVRNSILITEDVNLRSKALSNNLLVCAKSDLVSL